MFKSLVFLWLALSIGSKSRGTSMIKDQRL